MNKRNKDMKVNNALIAYLSTHLKANSNAMCARKAIAVMIEMHRRSVWRDARVVNIIAGATLHTDLKVSLAAAHFMLGNKTKGQDDDASDEEQTKHDTAEVAREIVGARKTAGRIKKLKKAKLMVKKQAEKKKKKAKGGSDGVVNFAVLDLVYDPQTLAEQIFARVRGNKEPFSFRLVLLNLTSRLIGRHQLFVMSFYSHVMRYLRPTQREVTQVLACVAQATHPLIPPDELHPLSKCLMNTFVSENNSSQVIAVGLNAIREVCARAPLALDADMLADLCEFRTYKDKGVMMAAKGLINQYRDTYPSLLPKAMRGKEGTMAVIAHKDNRPQYGQSTAATQVEGIDLLAKKAQQHEQEQPEDDEQEQDEDDEQGDGQQPDEDSDLDIDEDDLDELLDDDSDADEGEDDLQEEGEPRGKGTKRKRPDDEQQSTDTTSAAMFDRVLGQEDFAKIRRLKLKHDAEVAMGGKGKKPLSSQRAGGDEWETDSDAESDASGSEDEKSDDQEADTDRVNPDDLRGVSKKKRTRAEKLASVLKGRADKKKNKGKNKGAGDAAAAVVSMPNAVKSRNKPIMMVRNKRALQDKRKQDLQTKVAGLRKHIKNLRMKTGGKARRRKK
mmetsp:Transcript_18022/g.51251  ORF Transcript_18022/g.51251 Transcript_18022/m.51251 type:complete len:614 (-) Transcript_18022:420-2261(-)